MQDLRDEKIRNRLRLIWENPTELDPARHSANVTRKISSRLAEVSKAREKRGEHKPEAVALFLMRGAGEFRVFARARADIAGLACQ